MNLSRYFMRSVFALAFLASPVRPAIAAELSYYLPEATSYDDSIPTPKEVLGYEVGEWHVRHDQLVAYMRTLAERSDRMTLETTGRTYEHRELLQLTITSPDNHARLEDIRREHLQLSQPGTETPRPEAMPVVLYLGYSVHGDESSGGNAALLAAYHLAAARGPEMENLLRHAVILLDPCLNPDGFNRFAQWANSHRGLHPVGDPNHREHNAVWPAGRGNHYWFDLNRDWLLLQHPESRARLEQFHRWKPNVVADFHEMGSHSTFFFQPGVPERRNPLTPQSNVSMTEAIARYHASVLDDVGSLYYTEERFDDYYYGKGSTYPDIHGAIGILFEQASTRGHLREAEHGEFDFPFTIRNQFLTTLSTLQAAAENRVELLQYQREFYQDALAEARRRGQGGFVFGHPHDAVRNHLFLDVLLRHQIEVYPVRETIETQSMPFHPGWAYVVPRQQPQTVLARTIFETVAEFPDNIFYDVSTWTFPLAMGLPSAEVETIPASAMGARLSTAEFPEARPLPELDKAPYAYTFSWKSTYAARALYRLLDADVHARVAMKPFVAGKHRMGLGAIVIPMGLQAEDHAAIVPLLRQAALEDGVEVHALSTGLTEEGIDLGSPSLRSLTKPQPAIVIGDGVSAYEAGEAWHLLDRRFGVEVTLLEKDSLSSADLSRYTHLILVNGSYGAVPDSGVEDIRRWVEEGGVLVAIKSATRWVGDKKLAAAEFIKEENEESGEKDGKKDEPEEEPAERLDYGDFDKHEDAKRLSGAFFAVDLDITHPLGYGYHERALAVFRNSRIYLEPSKNPYGTVAQYLEEPLLSGYVHQEELKKLRGSAAIVVEKKGEGTVILMVDNPNFRAYTHGTSRLFLNAIFFGDLVQKTKE